MRCLYVIDCSAKVFVAICLQVEKTSVANIINNLEKLCELTSAEVDEVEPKYPGY